MQMLGAQQQISNQALNISSLGLESCIVRFG
ncbi:MAG: hypothetical protein JWM55_1724 [Acidimicrobiaceae bacterium]|nr:hypothetical protein [Acidimicrobiaceae bacterium]